MEVISLERPAHAAPRMWRSGPKTGPQLITPRPAFVKRWGGRYNWGAGAKGCLLTSAQLLYEAGLALHACIYLAEHFRDKVTLHLAGPLVRFELPVLKTIALSMCEEQLLGLASFLARVRRKRRGN